MSSGMLYTMRTQQQEVVMDERNVGTPVAGSPCDSTIVSNVSLVGSDKCDQRHVNQRHVVCHNTFGDGSGSG